MKDEEKIKSLKGLIERFRPLEADYFDWKIKGPDNKEIPEHLSAMSFLDHGYLIIGVDDNGGVMGVGLDEIKRIRSQINNKQNEETLGVYSWSDEQKIDDVVDFHIISIEPDRFLYIIEVNSSSSFIWVKNKKSEERRFWMRAGESSLEVRGFKEAFMNKILMKYDVGRRQQKAQEYFDTIVDLVRDTTVDYYLKKTPPRNVSLERFRTLDQEFLNETMKVSINHGRTEIDNGEVTWSFPAEINLWSKENDKSIVDRRSNERTGGSLEDIKTFFKKYKDSLIHRHHFIIHFDETSLPDNMEVLRQALTDKETREHVFSAGSGSNQSKFFLEYITRGFKDFKFIVESPNSAPDLRIQYMNETYASNGTNLVITQHISKGEDVESRFKWLYDQVSS